MNINDVLLNLKFLGLYYYAEGLSHVTIIRDEDTVTATADINKVIKVNPLFYDSLSVDSKTTLLCHELLHILLNHNQTYHKSIKKEGARHRVFNVACDVIINEMLYDDGLSNIGNNRGFDLELLKDEFDVRISKQELARLDCVDLYKILCNYIEDVDVPEEDLSFDYEEGDRDLSEIINNFYQERNIKQALDKVQRNKDIHRKKLIFEQWAKSELGKELVSDYKKPSRRTIELENIFLKAKYRKPAYGRVLLIVDVSGSMSNEEVHLSKQVIKSFGREVDIITHDTQLHIGKQGLSKKGGGTDFVPVFQYINNNHSRYDKIVWITDGDGSYPKHVDGKTLDNTTIFLTKQGVEIPSIAGVNVDKICISLF